MVLIFKLVAGSFYAGDGNTKDSLAGKARLAIKYITMAAY